MNANNKHKQATTPRLTIPDILNIADEWQVNANGTVAVSLVLRGTLGKLACREANRQMREQDRADAKREREHQRLLKRNPEYRAAFERVQELTRKEDEPLAPPIPTKR